MSLHSTCFLTHSLTAVTAMRVLTTSNKVRRCTKTLHLSSVVCIIRSYSTCAGTQPAHCLSAAHIHGLQCRGLCSGGSAVDFDGSGAQQCHTVAAEGHILCFHCPRIYLGSHWLPAVWRQALSHAQKVMAIFTVARLVHVKSRRCCAFTLQSTARAGTWQQ